MLRTDGILPALDEDRFILDRAWMVSDKLGVVAYYFGWRTSVAQALRVVDPGVPVELIRFGMWGEDSKWIGLEEAPPLKTAGEVLQWLAAHCERGDLINFGCRLGDGLALQSHDDTEVTLQGPEGSWIREWAEALFASRGFNAKVVLDAMDQNVGKYMAIGWPDEISGVYDTIEELRKSHPRR